MTLLEKLIFVFLCFAIAAGALIWIARIRQARVSARYRADFARPFGAGNLTTRPEAEPRIRQLTPEQRAAISSWSRGEYRDDEVTEVAR